MVAKLLRKSLGEQSKTAEPAYAVILGFENSPHQMIEKEIFTRSVIKILYLIYRKEKPCLSFLSLPVRIPAASALRPSTLLVLA